jgi:hypothetical protein
MSYEKHVYPSIVPPNLAPLWVEALRNRGLEVAFHPEFDPLRWDEGFLPCRLTVQSGAFPGAERFGSSALETGFEFSAITDADEKAELLNDYEEEMEAEGAPLPEDLLDRLKAAPAIFTLSHGGFGWTAAEFRVCWFAAATLAELTKGLLFDEWADGECHGYCSPEQALTYAAASSDRYESSPDSGPEVWEIPRFRKW